MKVFIFIISTINLLSQNIYYENFNRFMNQNGVVSFEINLNQKQYGEEFISNGIFYYFNADKYIFDSENQRVTFEKGQIQTINKINKQIIYENSIPNDFTVFDLFSGERELLNVYNYEVLNNDVIIFFKIDKLAILGSLLTDIDSGKPELIKFTVQKNMKTEIEILSSNVSTHFSLEKLENESFDIVDLRE